MDIPNLMTSLGGSIFIDDYERLVPQLPVEVMNDDSEERIRLQILNALYEALTGNLGMAREILHERYENITYDAESTFRLATWGSYVACLRRYPPLIRFRPELGGWMATERSALLQYKAMVLESDARINEYPDQELARAEAFIMSKLHFYPLYLWTDSFTQNPAYPRGQWTNNRLESAARLEAQIAQLLSSSTACSTYSPKLSRYLKRSAVDLDASRMVLSTFDMYRTLTEECETHWDVAGAGAIKMLEADLRLSPPFTSPIAFNLVPIDTSDIGTANVQWDATEDGLQLVEDHMATELYMEALQNFSRAGSGRGVAAVKLRQGSIAHAHALQCLPASSERRTSTILAEKLFSQALLAAGADRAQAMLIQGHQLLLRLSSGEYCQSREIAASIGRWGVDSKNEGVSHFVGWLMMRFGRRQALEHLDMKLAYSCFRCARHLFDALGDRVGAFQASTAEIQLHHAWSNDVAARSLIDEQLPIFRQITSQVLETFNTDGSTSNLMIRHNMIITFGALLSNIYRVSGDNQSLRKWQEERQTLHDHPATQELVRDAVENPWNATHIIGGPTIARQRGALPELEQTDQILFDAYHEANNTFHALLQENRLLEGEHVMREFLSEVESLSGSDYAKMLLSVYVSYQIGDWAGVRSQLAALENDVLYDDSTKTIQRFDTPWCRPKFTSILSNTSQWEIAIAISCLARDWDRSGAILRRAIQLFPGYLDTNNGELLEEPWSRLMWAGLVEEGNHHHFQAFDYLAQAATILERVRMNGVDVDSRRTSFAVGGTSELYFSLVKICMRCDALGIPLQVLVTTSINYPFAKSWLEYALVFLERSNARSLVDTVQSGGEQELEESTALYLSRARRRMYLKALSTEARSQDEAEELVRLESQAIGEEGDLQFDMLASQQIGLDVSPAEWFKSIGQSTVVLYYRFSRSGSASLAITHEGIQTPNLGSTNDITMRKYVTAVMYELKQYGIDASSANSERLHSSLSDISRELLDPFRQLIDCAQTLIFVCSQPLSAFPFSALPYNGQPLFLQKTLSQVPSLTVLEHLCRSRREIDPAKISPIVKANGTRLFGDIYDEHPLPMAGLEAVFLADLFDTTLRDGSTIDRTQFKAEFQRSDLMLLATHGSLDIRSPMLSNISLKELLRVIDLTRLCKSPSMVIFSACLSGLGTATAANDIAGFSHAVLSCGCLAFLGTLWEVDDVGTLFLMTLFYMNLKKAGTSASIAEVLAVAQREFYLMTEDSFQQHVQLLTRSWTHMEEKGMEPSRLVARGKYFLSRLHLKFSTIDWTHPFYYAGVALLGNGSLKLRSLDR